jgi:hypothetical protein
MVSDVLEVDLVARCHVDAVTGLPVLRVDQPQVVVEPDGAVVEPHVVVGAQA